MSITRTSPSSPSSVAATGEATSPVAAPLEAPSSVAAPLEAPSSTPVRSRASTADPDPSHDVAVPRRGRTRRSAAAAVVAVGALLRGALADAAPRHRYQRAMYGAGALMLASGTVHLGVWAVDGGAWEGEVSWRKPILFGISFGMFLLSAGWVQGVLPRSRRWGWTTTVLIAGGGVAEVALITAQRWRGVASHFNLATPVDAAIFGLMGTTIVVFGAGIVALAVWAARGVRRPAPTAVAALVGLGLVLVASAQGQDLIVRGLAYVEANDAVPPAVVIGVAGSGKLAHAVALHGIQVLGVLALLLGRSGLRAPTRTRAMVTSAAGYVALTGLVMGQAYAGRSMLDVHAAMLAALALSTLAVVLPFALVLGDAVRAGTRSHR